MREGFIVPFAGPGSSERTAGAYTRSSATSIVTPTDGGSPTRLSALDSSALSFEVQYEGYRAAYHLDRVTGTFSQRPNLGGIFFGRCEMKPYTTKF